MTARAGYVCGVDLGTTYATFCLLPANATTPPAFGIWRTAKTELGSNPEGARSLAGNARAELAEFKWLIRHVRFERPMGQHVRSVANLSRTLGALSTIWSWETSVDEIQPNEWKRACGLSGNASAGAYRLWAERVVRPLELVEHEAAAYGVAVSIIVDSARAGHASSEIREPFARSGDESSAGHKVSEAQSRHARTTLKGEAT